jgi:yecA family protein
MKYRAPYHSRHERPAAHMLMPPPSQIVASLPFTDERFLELDAWLAEEGWPRERMDAAMLEGYLVALLVWPVEISAGAWLPTVWGIRGWKVAAKIATAETYSRFLDLVIGFRQETERRLTASPALRPFVLERAAPVLSARYFAGAAWATGFLNALQENFAGLGSRTASARSAVETIASFASLRSANSSSMASVCADLNAAVSKLMEERSARKAPGPLPVGPAGVAKLGPQRRAVVKLPTVQLL